MGFGLSHRQAGSTGTFSQSGGVNNTTNGGVILGYNSGSSGTIASAAPRS